MGHTLLHVATSKCILLYIIKCECTILLLIFFLIFLLLVGKVFERKKEKNGKKSKINAILEHVYTYI